MSVSEWAAVLTVNLYALTFYWDLGEGYFIEQVHERLGAWRSSGDERLDQDDEPGLNMSTL